MELERKIAELATGAIGRRIFPGCVVGVVHDHLRSLQAFGKHTYEPDSPQVREDTVYDVASLTKSVALATLAHQLLATKEISLTTKLIEFVPEYQGGYRDEITVRHLLTYTVGGIRLSEFTEAGADEIMRVALNFQPTHPPGEHFEYSNVPAFLLGLLVERLMGPLDVAAAAHIWKPLDMSATTFLPDEQLTMLLIPPAEEGVQGIVHDESARVFRKAGKSVGHAGLFSNVPDLLKFLDAFHEGRMDSHPAETNQIPHLGEFTALGWELNQGHFMGAHRSSHTFGKTGFTGCSIVCDAHRRISVVILSNRTFPKRPSDASAINEFRNAVCDIVFA
ncbi:MAG: serine hydrolase domain-containing protein [Patescibacteria group bacterium]